LLPLVEPDLDLISDDFYDEINRHPMARAVITEGESQIQRLKKTLRQWLVELFSGEYDDDYIARRWKVGWRHVEIGLNQAYPNLALARLRQGLIRAIEGRWTGDAHSLATSLATLHKLIDLDLALMTDAYETESRIRLQRTERMATIGQVAGGIAHELRNPLNVVKTSVYYLLNARTPSPERTREHLERVDRQVGVADGVITALSNFAKMPLPNFRPIRCSKLVETALESCVIPANVELCRELPDSVPMVLGDTEQLAIVVSNLIRNAVDAMPEGGTLTFRARGEDSGRIVLEVIDSGVGIPPEKIGMILEPLYSTKARGIGLGLAISKAILEKNNGTMKVTSKVGEGTNFTLTLAGVDDGDSIQDGRK
jgi:signal transduction histidine kinase